MQILKYCILFIIILIFIIALLGMYKFNYLASNDDYDVDGNKIRTNLSK